MQQRYDYKNNINTLQLSPYSESILNQREITIHSYQTSVPFDYVKISKGLESAWLTPKNRLGIFARGFIESSDKEWISIVLGLQDNLHIRAYDYDNRRPLWFSWQNAIVETVNLHYFKDEEGFLRFTTTGGGKRIKAKSLNQFNLNFLDISPEAITQRYFDLSKLRQLCFERFLERLYKLRFSDPSVKEYQSIDHASFQSRKYIDPQSERLKEVCDDPYVKVESFDSDIEITAEELLKPVKVRFFIKGQSGALRLKLPKMRYKDQYNSVELQTQAYYRVIDSVVTKILDKDYYVHQKVSLDELEKSLGLFPDAVDLTPYQEALRDPQMRQDFLTTLDFETNWQKWLPSLRALNNLLQLEDIKKDVSDILMQKISLSPLTATSLLKAAREYSGLSRIAKITAEIVIQINYNINPVFRTQVETELLLWAIGNEKDLWDVNPQSGEIKLSKLRWKPDDLSNNILIRALEKLIDIFNERLINQDSDIEGLLIKLDWCFRTVKTLLPNDISLPSSFKLIKNELVPNSLNKADKILACPVDDIGSMDREVLSQFGLPLWPLLSACRKVDKLTLSNTGNGCAVNLKFEDHKPFDLIAGSSKTFKTDQDLNDIEIEFTKYDRQYRITIPVNEQITNLDAPRFEWITQAQAGRALNSVLGKDEAPDKSTISRAVKNGDIEFNGLSGRQSKLKVKSFLNWIQCTNDLGVDELKQVRNAIIGEMTESLEL
ncbi:MAG: hypothetical protein ACIAQZ_13535 [Sedimentisphaeraceae bacterium JB056]